MNRPESSPSQGSIRGRSLSQSGLGSPRIDSLRERWRTSGKWTVEQVLTSEPAWRDNADAVLDLVYLETELRRAEGDSPTLAEYVARFPTLAPAIQDLFAVDEAVSPRLGDETHDFGGNSDVAPQLAFDAEATTADPALPVANAKRRSVADTRLPLLDGYEMLGEIARGGMGVVFKARQTKLNRLVAVKMILPGQLASPEAIERFYSEAQAAARLDHPGIVPIYEVDEAAGVHFFSMGYVEGESLADRVARGPIPQQEAARLVEAIADAVQYAHERKVVHRDLKPRNILLTSDGEPKVTDFGLAKQTESDRELTTSGQIMGTPSYMPPEQAAGKLDQIGPRSDVYSIGAILYCLLTGRPPFQAASVVDTLRAVLETPPVPPKALDRSVDQDLETICLKCLEKAPEHRYGSARDVADELRRWRAGEPIRARRLGTLGLTWRWARRRPQFVAATFVIVALAGVALAAGAAVWRSERNRTLGESSRKIEALLAALDESPASFRAVEAALDEHVQVDPVAALTLRTRAIEAYAAAIERSLKRSRIDDQEFSELESAVRIIAQDDPQRGERLEGEISARKEVWQTYFEVSAPFVPSVLERVSDLARADDGSYLQQLDLANRQRRPEIKQPAGNAAEMQATFDATWPERERLGVAMGSDGESGYEFALVAQRDGDQPSGESSESGADKPWSFAAARTSGASFALEIRRNGNTLVRRPIDPGALPAGALTIRGVRDGDQLTAQVGDLPPLRFVDPFPVDAANGARYGLVPSPGARVTRLKARSRPRAAIVSTLREGDDLYSAGKFAEAIERYVRQATDDPKVATEVEFKVGMCRLARNELAEAEERFATVFPQEESKWSGPAGCRLWQTQIRQDKSDAAYLTFEALAARTAGKGLGAIVPEDVRDEVRRLSQGWEEGFRIANLLRIRPERVEASRRLAAIDRFFSLDGQGDVSIQTNVARELAIAGDVAGALAAVEPIGRQGATTLAVLHFARVLRLNKRTDNAREAIVKHQLGRPMPATSLQWELARGYAAEGDWAKCEAMVDGLLLTGGDGPKTRLFQTTNSLMKGFLLDRRGARAAALRAWKAGVTDLPAEDRDASANVIVPLLNEAVLRSLCDQVDDAFTERFMAELARSGGDNPLLRQVDAMVDRATMTQVLRRMWRSPFGRKLAEDFAFERGSLRDRIVVPVALAITEYANLAAFSGEMTDEDYPVVYAGMLDACDKFVFKRELGVVQVAGLVAAWKGSTGAFGWSGVAPTLPPDTRRFVAYVLAHRWRAKGDVAGAIKALQDQIASEAESNAIIRASRRDLARLTEGKGTIVFDAPTGCAAKFRIESENGSGIDVDLATDREVDVLAGKFKVVVAEDSAPGTLSVAEGEVESLRKARIAFRPADFVVAGEPNRTLRGIIAAPEQTESADRWQLSHRFPQSTMFPLIAASPDGRRAALAQGDRYVRIVDVATGELARILPASDSNAIDIRWSSDGEWIVASYRSREVNVWRVSDGRRVQTIPLASQSGPLTLEQTFSPRQGPFALLAASGEGIRRLEGVGRTALAHRGAATEWMRSIVTTSAGAPTALLGLSGAPPASEIPRRLAMVCDDGRRRYLRAWSDETGSLIQLYEWYAASPSAGAVGFSGDGRWLAATTGDGVLRLWRTDDWRVVRSTEIPRIERASRLHWSGDDALIAAVADNRVVVAEGNLKTEQATDLNDLVVREIEVPNAVNAVAIDQGRSLLVVDYSPNLRRVDLVDGRVTAIGEHRTNWIAVMATRPDPWRASNAPGARSLNDVAMAVLDGGGKVRFLDASGRLLSSTSRAFSHGAPVALAWRGDGAKLAVGYAYGGLQIVGANGTSLGSHDFGLATRRHSLTWSPDGKSLLAIDATGTIQRFDEDAKPLGEFPLDSADEGSPVVIDAHPVGFLAIGFQRPVVMVTRPDGQVATTIRLPEERGEVRSCRFSPDGRDLLISQRDKRCGIWSVDGTPLAIDIPMEESAPDSTLVWLADGSGVLTATWSPAELHIHDRTGKRVSRVPSSQVVYGQHLAGMSVEGPWWIADPLGTLRAIDQTGRVVGRTIQFAPNGRAVALTPEGRVVDGDAQDLDDDFVVAIENDDESLRIAKPSEFLRRAPAASPAPGR